MKKVLVSGGCGFLGSHLVDHLLLRNDIERILVVDNLWTGKTQESCPHQGPSSRLYRVQRREIQYEGAFRRDHSSRLARVAALVHA